MRFVIRIAMESLGLCSDIWFERRIASIEQGLKKMGGVNIWPFLIGFVQKTTAVFPLTSETMYSVDWIPATQTIDHIIMHLSHHHHTDKHDELQ